MLVEANLLLTKADELNHLIDHLYVEIHELQRYKTWMREFAPDVYKMITGDEE